MRPTTPSPWAVILAGGDGTRLRPLTQRLVGDARPKQFCPLFGTETLLDRTRRRTDLVIRPDRQVVVVTAAHAPYYAGLAGELLPGRLLVQPSNRGTTSAIVLAALAVGRLAGDVPIVVLPSDHDVADEVTFMQAVGGAIEAVDERRESVLLLGIEPTRAETEYGWIEPAHGTAGEVVAIRRFFEKPSAALARRLFETGCLWNSFVMVGWASAFTALVAATLPDVAAAFAPVGRALGTEAEARAVRRAYAVTPALGFSEGVLARAPERLAVMRVKDVGWCDVGSPRRAAESARRRGHAPAWLTAVAAAGS